MYVAKVFTLINVSIHDLFEKMLLRGECFVLVVLYLYLETNCNFSLYSDIIAFRFLPWRRIVKGWIHTFARFYEAMITLISWLVWLLTQPDGYLIVPVNSRLTRVNGYLGLIKSEKVWLEILSTSEGNRSPQEVASEIRSVLKLEISLTVFSLEQTGNWLIRVALMIVISLLLFDVSCNASWSALRLPIF